jgi:hypothetical protein
MQQTNDTSIKERWNQTASERKKAMLDVNND